MTSNATEVHENLSRSNAVKIGSDRSFGLVFAVVFGLIGALRLWHAHWSGPAWLGGAAAFLAISFAAPAFLHPLNLAWFRFGLLLHAIVNPLIMGVLFFGVITPIGLLMRLFGKRPLHLTLDRAAASYWVARVPPGPAPESLKNQF